MPALTEAVISEGCDRRLAIRWNATVITGSHTGLAGAVTTGSHTGPNATVTAGSHTGLAGPVTAGSQSGRTRP